MWQNRLRLFVELNEQTQASIAFAAGIEQGTLSNIIRGNRSASIQLLEKLCDILGVTMADLFVPESESKGYQRLLAERDQRHQTREEEHEYLKLELTALIENSSPNAVEELRGLLPLLKKALR